MRMVENDVKMCGDTSEFTTIFGIVGALLAAAIGSLITFWGSYKLLLRSEKKEKRAMISVGIFDNIKDDICARLNNSTNVWFLDTDALDSYVNNRVYYLNIIQNNKNIFIHNCKMRIEKDDGAVIYNYNVGSLTERTAMVPLKVRKNTKRVALILNYMTEENEVMLYRMNLEFDRGEIVGTNDLWGCALKKHKNFKSNDYYLYDKNKQCKYKVFISENDSFIDQSYSGQEIIQLLNNKSLNYVAENLQSPSNCSKAENSLKADQEKQKDKQ